jgi:CheY-like chemotaxis protein
LPDIPGWEVLSRLKSLPETRRIPVVVISADATKSQIKRLMTAGAARYLTKPLDVNEFFQVIDQTFVSNGVGLAVNDQSNGELSTSPSAAENN